MKIIKVFCENISNIKKTKNTKNNEENSKSNPTTKTSNTTRFQAIKDRVLFSIKHKSRIKGLFASIVIKSTWFCRKRFSVWNQTLRLTLKMCYWCMKTLNYCLMMSYDCEDAKKWNKSSQKLVTKAMFLGRTLRTPTQILPRNASAYCQTQKSIPSLKTESFLFTQTTLS